MGWRPIRSVRGGWPRGSDCDLWCSRLGGRLRLVISLREDVLEKHGFDSERASVWIGTLRDRDLIKLKPAGPGEQGFKLRRSGTRRNLVLTASTFGIEREYGRTEAKTGKDREDGGLLITMPHWIPRDQGK